VTTIPQEPTMFKGTLRFNIDPEEKSNNEDIKSLLKRSGLQDILKVEKDKDILDFEIEEGGNNLSAGEK